MVKKGFDSDIYMRRQTAEILKRISEDDFSFHNLDFTLPFDLSKKYDFIYSRRD